MSGNRLERARTAIKRKRGDLIELDYFAIANKMMSDEVFSEEKHRQIKRDRKSDSGKMDELLDVVIESSSDAIISSFMEAVQKQNQALSKKIENDYELHIEAEEAEAERISVATDIFSNSQSQSNAIELISLIDENHEDENEAHVVNSNTDGETFVSSSRATFNNTTTQTYRSGINNSSVDYIPTETQIFEFPANFTGKIYTMKEVNEKLSTAFSSHSFTIETCWIKGFDTMYYRKGTDMVYKGCLHCQKGVKKVNDSRSADLYECGANHRASSYKTIACLKFLQLEDSTASVKQVAMFSEQVERFLGMKTGEIVNLDEKGVKKVVDNIRSFNYKIVLRCTPRNRCISSQVMEISSSPFDWDFKVINILERRVVAPQLQLRVTLL